MDYAENKLYEIEIKVLRTNPKQPRKYFADSAIEKKMALRLRKNRSVTESTQKALEFNF